MFTKESLRIKTLGPREVDSPLGLSTTPDDLIADYVADEARVVLEIECREGEPFTGGSMFEKAGPRQKIFFEPAKTRVGIVSCGGLCPGINNVIRSLVLELHHKYQVKEILGYRYGYEGLNPAVGLPPMQLTPSEVISIHRQGGSILGLSRGKQPIETMVETLLRDQVDVLFTIGGDGTMRGAHAIAEELERRSARIAIVGIPKSIDNDVAFVDKTFGFDTAVDAARQTIDAAHTEAIGARNGVGLVKLMGRDAGFIAAYATLASREANFCLIPEVRFELEGPNGLLRALERRLAARGHAVIVLAEGCADSMSMAETEKDASGNVRYTSPNLDVGIRLRDEILRHCKANQIPIQLKYIDPSYLIRGVPANSNDSIFCDILARNAAHAGMAGKTDLVVGRLHHILTHVPLSLAASQRKHINPDGEIWLAVSEATGQARLLNLTSSGIFSAVKHPKKALG